MRVFFVTSLGWFAVLIPMSLASISGLLAADRNGSNAGEDGLRAKIPPACCNCSCSMEGCWAAGMGCRLYNHIGSMRRRWLVGFVVGSGVRAHPWLGALYVLVFHSLVFSPGSVQHANSAALSSPRSSVRISNSQQREIQRRQSLALPAMNEAEWPKQRPPW